MIQALDELKKFNPGAREAIKFLEQELKKGNRFTINTSFDIMTCPVVSLYSFSNL